MGKVALVAPTAAPLIAPASAEGMARSNRKHGKGHEDGTFEKLFEKRDRHLHAWAGGVTGLLQHTVGDLQRSTHRGTMRSIVADLAHNSLYRECLDGRKQQHTIRTPRISAFIFSALRLSV